MSPRDQMEALEVMERDRDTFMRANEVGVAQTIQTHIDLVRSALQAQQPTPDGERERWELDGSIADVKAMARAWLAVYELLDELGIRRLGHYSAKEGALKAIRELHDRTALLREAQQPERERVIFRDLSGVDREGVIVAQVPPGQVVVEFDGAKEGILVAHDAEGREVWDGDALVIARQYLRPWVQEPSAQPDARGRGDQP